MSKCNNDCLHCTRPPEKCFGGDHHSALPWPNRPWQALKEEEHEKLFHASTGRKAPKHNTFIKGGH